MSITRNVLIHATLSGIFKSFLNIVIIKADSDITCSTVLAPQLFAWDFLRCGVGTAR